MRIVLQMGMDLLEITPVFGYCIDEEQAMMKIKEELDYKNLFNETRTKSRKSLNVTDGKLITEPIELVNFDSR